MDSNEKFYVIYDQDFPMVGHWSRQFIIQHAHDLVDDLWAVEYVVYYHNVDLVMRAECKADLFDAAKYVLKEFYGKLKVYPAMDIGDFVWECTELGIFDECKKLIEEVDPEFAATELGE